MTVPALKVCRALVWGLSMLVGAALVAIGIHVATPYLDRAGPTKLPEEAPLPKYDLTEWQSLAVQMGGRAMPFETAAINGLRQVTGRSKFAGHDATAVVLSWMLTQGGTRELPAGITNWEETPLLLCEDPRLRGPILAEALKLDLKKGEVVPEDQLHGKYLSPKQVRNSKALREWLMTASQKRREDPERGSQYFTTEERKAEELAARLRMYDSFTQGDPIVQSRLGHQKPDDPLHFVALDKVPNSPWFSMGELEQCIKDPAAWRQLLVKRVQATPHLYLSPEHREMLLAFQKAIAEGKEETLLNSLGKKLAQRRADRFGRVRELLKEGKLEEAQNYFVTQVLRTEEEMEAIEKFIKNDSAGGTPQEKVAKIVAETEKKQAELDQSKLDLLAREAVRARKVGYVPEKDEFRSLHMIYLELQDPKLYEAAANWQSFPEPKARKTLLAWSDLRGAYASAKPDVFAEASKGFLSLVAAISREAQPDYPNLPTLELERQYNRAEPFKWAWVTMALATLLFALSLGFTNRFVYTLAFVPFLASLVMQGYGYYARVMISGRPPVTNMYETVVFVASMAALFALVLELIYRPKYIILAGGLVATLGLVLADQLPVSNGFDSSIQPLVPVLRSNFWLIIHVMTIVASYAAGALAWSMGNIVLLKYLFRTPEPTELKHLTKLTYRAMQIAVLLLAAGTFLGGWWAAYSWGRFWGWDPKETWALIALIAYVIPLHMRFIGWIKDFGLAVSAVVCFASIVMSWYGVNFILGAGLHSYGFGGGGPWYVFFACLLNLQFVLLVCGVNLGRKLAATTANEGLIQPAAQ